MSSSPGRRRRLAIARTFPQATCDVCGADLSRVTLVSVHVARCQARARAEQAAASVPPVQAAPSILDRLRGAVGIHSRGASR